MKVKWVSEMSHKIELNDVERLVELVGNGDEDASEDVYDAIDD